MRDDANITGQLREIDVRQEVEGRRQKAEDRRQKQKLKLRH